jgi:hypothetical protein
MHPLAVRVLVNLNDNGNAAEYTTAAFKPGAFRLVLAMVSTDDTVLPDAHALTSLHGTWTEVARTNVNTIATPLTRVSLWRLMTTNGVVSSTLTNKFSNAATGCNISVMEFISVRTDGTGGAGAITNITMAAADATANSTVTPATEINPRNGTYAGAANDVNPFAGTPEVDWIEDEDAGHSAPNSGIYVTHRNNTLDNTVVVTRASTDWGIFGAIIKVQYQ